MENINELAWKVIDHWVADYDSKEDAIVELGDLDQLVFRVIEQIEINDLNKEDGIVFIASTVECALF